MASKPDNEKAPSSQTPSGQTPAEVPGTPVRELSEDELKQATGGAITSRRSHGLPSSGCQ
jgi:hypothetical protein